MEYGFEELGLSSDLAEGLKMQGITLPTDVQSRAIPPALKNMDIICRSQTGSGKTLAYLLPLFQKIDSNKKEMQAIVLAPTHELVMQIERQVKLLSENSGKNVTSASIIGKVNIARQVEKLKEKPNIITGSAGRILELIKMRKINTQTVRTIVIDEADMLLDENNFKSVRDVIKTTMRDRQLMAFSATVNEKALSAAMSLMKDPQIIKIEDNDTVNPDIRHIYFVAEQRDKIEILRKLIASIKPEKAIIFINKTLEIEMTILKLAYHHLNVCGIYGKSPKQDRQRALTGFRNGDFQLLVASDIAARGLDIKDVSHIFNLDLPEDPKGYLHRSGRTGRTGNTGISISIVTPDEVSIIRDYEKKFNIAIEEKAIFKGVITDPHSTRKYAKKKSGEKAAVRIRKIKKSNPHI